VAAVLAEHLDHQIGEAVDDFGLITEAFGRWKNLRIVVLALLGLTAGLGIVGYAGQFYLLLFLMQTVKIDPFDFFVPTLFPSRAA